MSSVKKAWVVYEGNPSVTDYYQDTIFIALRTAGIMPHKVSVEEMSTNLFG